MVTYFRCGSSKCTNEQFLGILLLQETVHGLCQDSFGQAIIGLNVYISKPPKDGITLDITTNMTSTQVSTWFANEATSQGGEQVDLGANDDDDDCGSDPGADYHNSFSSRDHHHHHQKRSGVKNG